MKTLLYIVGTVLMLNLASCMAGPKEARTETTTYWDHADRDEWYDGD